MDGVYMLKNYISKRIALLRTKKNVSARAMSQALGQNASYINRIENGQAMPSFEVLPYIFDYLGVTAAEFFDDSNSDPSLLRELVTELKTLDAKQLEVVKSVVANFKK